MSVNGYTRQAKEQRSRRTENVPAGGLQVWQRAVGWKRTALVAEGVIVVQECF
jgi:hypothetical protein